MVVEVEERGTTKNTESMEQKGAGEGERVLIDRACRSRQNTDPAPQRSRDGGCWGFTGSSGQAVIELQSAVWG